MLCSDDEQIPTQRRANEQLLVSELTVGDPLKEFGPSDCLLHNRFLDHVNARNSLRDFLASRGVYCSIHWPVYPYFLQHQNTADITESVWIQDHVPSIPVGQDYEANETEHICAACHNGDGPERHIIRALLRRLQCSGLATFGQRCGRVGRPAHNKVRQKYPTYGPFITTWSLMSARGTAGWRSATAFDTAGVLTADDFPLTNALLALVFLFFQRANFADSAIRQSGAQATEKSLAIRGAASHTFAAAFRTASGAGRLALVITAATFKQSTARQCHGGNAHIVTFHFVAVLFHFLQRAVLLTAKGRGFAAPPTRFAAASGFTVVASAHD